MCGGRAGALAAATALLAAGCNVGPRYQPPAVQPPPAFKESAPAQYTSTPAGTWRPANPQDATIKGKWWEIFNEPELNALEEQLDINNQNIKQFFQNFEAARAQVREAHAAYFPTVAVAPSLTVSGTAGGRTLGNLNTAVSTNAVSSSSTFTTVSLPVDASWAPDLWGRVRNTVRQFQSAAQVSAADLENLRLTEQSSLAQFYFELRAQDSLQDLYNQTIAAYRASLQLTQSLVETGIDSPESAAQAQLTLAQAEEVGAGIPANRAIFEHAIASLIGKPASEFSIPVRTLTTPLPPIPVGVPSGLLQRRPDIAGAERLMEEANALIGVGRAAYYPNVTLSGSGGLSATALKALFSVPSLFWSVGASVSETVFDAGLRGAVIQQYTAQYNANVAGYRQTVLVAFQQVEDSIASLRATSDQIIREGTAVEAAQANLNIVRARYETGLDPYLNVVSAELTLLGNQLTRVGLRSNEMLAAVQLIQALGGGWNVSELPSGSSITSDAAAQKVSHTP